MRRLSLVGVVRRPLHRQHDGLRVGGDRAGVAGFGGRAGPLRFTRRLRRGLGPDGNGVAAAGGSTNSGLHLPAIANEAGIDFDLHEVGKIFARTPYSGNLKPGGEYVMKDLYDIGGVPVLMRALLDGGYLHGDCITVTGKTIAENLKNIVFPEKQSVIRPTSNP